jgi:outer membrane receptor for ferrienterochelin and colicins
MRVHSLTVEGNEVVCVKSERIDSCPPSLMKCPLISTDVLQWHWACRPIIRAACRVLFCIMLLPLLAAGQEQDNTDLSKMSLEDLAKMQVDSVYGASKFLQKASDSPTVVTVVTAADIQKYGYRTLADVLQTVRGFYIIYDRNYTYIGVRGFSQPEDYNARVLFLVDGHRINDNIFDGAYVGTEFPVDVDLIDRIEIIRGPNSSVYGTGAFAAVINVITKRGRDLNGAETSAQAASWNSYKGRITYGERFDSGLETLASGSFYNSLGHDRLLFPEFDSPATNNGIARDADADQSYNVFGDVLYRDFDFHVVEGSRTKHIPTASFGTVFDDPRTRTTDTRGYAEVQYHHMFGSWETLGRLSYDWYEYHGIYVFDYARTGVPPYTENYDAANGTWWDFQGDVSRTFLEKHKLTMGTEFRQDLTQQQVNYDIQPYYSYFDSHRSSWLAALYAQDEYSLLKNLSFVAGARGDWYQRFGTTLSPRAGLLFRPEHNTDIRVNYSMAFRAPNDYESFYSGNNSNTANPALNPEKVRSWEIDVDHSFKKSYAVSGAAFLNRFSELITPTTDPVTETPIFLNSGPIQTKGLELQFSAKWRNGMEGSISDSAQISQNSVTGAALTNSPKQLAKLNFSLPLVQSRLFISSDAQYISPVTTVAQTRLGGYFITNFNFFTRKLTDRFDISAGLYNAFNKRYAESGTIDTAETSIVQDGRSFRITLTYRPVIRAE